MDREYNHNDYMDSALAPIEAQRDDALEELFKVKAQRDALLTVAKRLVETATVCRDCEWDVQTHELVQLLTSLEREAIEAIAQAKGGE